MKKGLLFRFYYLKKNKKCYTFIDTYPKIWRNLVLPKNHDTGVLLLTVLGAFMYNKKFPTPKNYSGLYVYCFFQIFPPLCLFQTLRLFQTLEYMTFQRKKGLRSLLSIRPWITFSRKLFLFEILFKNSFWSSFPKTHK